MAAAAPARKRARSSGGELLRHAIATFLPRTRAGRTRVESRIPSPERPGGKADPSGAAVAAEPDAAAGNAATASASRWGPAPEGERDRGGIR